MPVAPGGLNGHTTIESVFVRTDVSTLKLSQSLSSNFIDGGSFFAVRDGNSKGAKHYDYKLDKIAFYESKESVIDA